MITFFKRYQSPFLTIFTLEALVVIALRSTQASLILYAKNNLHLEELNAYELLAYLGIIIYSFPVLAGIIADKLLSQKQAMYLGLFFLTLGYCLLIIPDPQLIPLAISIIGCGSGFFKPNLPLLLNKLYPIETTDRATAFSLFYVASNVGTIIGTTLGGVLGHLWSWNYAIYLPLVSCFCAIPIFLLNLTKLKTLLSPSIQFTKIKALLLSGILMGLILVMFLIFRYQHTFFIIVGAFTAMIYISLSALRMKTTPTHNLLYALGIIASAVIFFSFSAQCYFALMLYVERFVDKHVFGFRYPSTWLLIINPFIVVGSGILLNYFKWSATSSFIRRTMLGFMLLACAYGILYLSALQLEVTLLISSLWIFGSYTLIAIAELIIIPSAIATITGLFPPHYKASFMGIWFLTMACSQFIAGQIAKSFAYPKDASLTTLVQGYQYAFMSLSLCILAIILVILLGHFLFKRYKTYAVSI